MTLQEKNKEMLRQYEKMLTIHDGRIIFSVGKTKEGKYIMLMDSDNDPKEVLDAVMQILKGFNKLIKGDISPDDVRPLDL